MKSARFNSLLASTALGLVLMLSSHTAGQAQQSDKPVQASVPMPDTSLPPPPTAKDVAGSPAAAPASEPAKAATPAPAPVTADATVTDKLREMIGGKLDRIVSRKADRDAVENYYKSHNYTPIWLTASAANERAQSAIAALAQADTVGLDPSDYPTPDFKSAVTADAQAEAELKLTAAVLTFARHAQAGRMSFTRVSPDLSFDPVAPEPAAVLAKLVDSKDAAAVLDSYNPPQAEFKALKVKLAEVRKNGGIAAPKVEEDKPITVKVGEGKILRPGMKDARVVALRKRLDVKGDKDSPLYDDAVRDAVKVFQTEADLDADGNLGANTVKALNGEKRAAKGPTIDPVDAIVVNMERWRWYPRDLGNPHVIVNIPNYHLALWNDDKIYWQTKIVVGKPGKNTPLISAEMKFITVNPTWNVPPSIIEKEYLPALQQDPQALDRIGLKLTQDTDGTVHIAQPPGAGNALGRIRFNFPNKYLVYQHDTPDKYLFAKEERAFSHGCMRVQNPLTYGEKLLSLVLPQEKYTEAKLEKMFGGSEININFPKNIWVHLTYQTAFVDEDGKLQLRKDVYGWDQRMIAILKGSERKVADIAVEQHMNSSSKPVKMTPGMYGGSSGGYSGGGFFDALFGGARAQQPVYRPQAPVNGQRGRFSQR